VLVLRKRCDSMGVMIESLCGVVESLVQRISVLERAKEETEGRPGVKRLKPGTYAVPSSAGLQAGAMGHIPEMPSPMLATAAGPPRHMVSPPGADSYLQQVMQARIQEARAYPASAMAQHPHPAARPMQRRPQRQVHEQAQQHPSRSQPRRRDAFYMAQASQDLSGAHPPFASSITQEDEGATKEELSFFEEVSSLLKDHGEARGSSGGG